MGVRMSTMEKGENRFTTDRGAASGAYAHGALAPVDAHLVGHTYFVLAFHCLDMDSGACNPEGNLLQIQLILDCKYLHFYTLCL